MQSDVVWLEIGKRGKSVVKKSHLCLEVLEFKSQKGLHPHLGDSR